MAKWIARGALNVQVAGLNLVIIVLLRPYIYISKYLLMDLVHVQGRSL